MDKEPLVEKYGSTIPMLMNYMHLGIISRSFMLNRHREDLKSLKENENHGKNDELTEFLIYKEMFERVCVAIEDFSIINLLIKYSPFTKSATWHSHNIFEVCHLRLHRCGDILEEFDPNL